MDQDGDPLALSISRAKALHDQDPTCRSLGISLGDVGPGRAVVRLRLTAEMVNGHGIAHGGFLFLLADAAFSFACNTHGPVTVAQGAQVSFLQPAAAGDELTAEAVERTRVGRHGVYDVTVRKADGTVVAEFRGQSTMLSGRPGTAG
ncbi:hydroxyphenylacetyl-CoA thioesterase PaaI [Kitasatospora sp. NPDC048540]|uniref:hydroxyphenylacetyl-CoA thioesterase PaaI n=1 Tax=unclassified Kitasatospora TaxID=2633591 RepID=UPI0006908EA5|nr:hydroxyphenylacetyl-CoA thioesterase PaaI [Kitasatospora sp. MBT63]